MTRLICSLALALGAATLTSCYAKDYPLGVGYLNGFPNYNHGFGPDRYPNYQPAPLYSDYYYSFTESPSSPRSPAYARSDSYRRHPPQDRCGPNYRTRTY